MTTEEKLQSFYESSTEEAARQAEAMLADHEAALNQIFEEHQADMRRKADLQIQTETDKLKKNANKALSKAQLDIKRELGEEQEHLKEELFSEVSDLLANFMETEEYNKLLAKQIKDALAFAKSDKIIIYIDPVDEHKRQTLEYNTGASLTISEYSFQGGTRAVIPSRNILIDNSFEAKAAQVKHDFKFRFGEENGNA